MPKPKLPPNAHSNSPSQFARLIVGRPKREARVGAMRSQVGAERLNANSTPLPAKTCLGRFIGSQRSGPKRRKSARKSRETLGPKQQTARPETNLICAAQRSAQFVKTAARFRRPKWVQLAADWTREIPSAWAPDKKRANDNQLRSLGAEKHWRHINKRPFELIVHLLFLAMEPIIVSDSRNPPRGSL